MTQPFMTDLAELTEDLKVSTGFAQHTAGLEQQLIEVAADLDAFGLQGPGHRGIATGFMDAVFLVEMHRVDLQLPAQLEQHGRSVIPAGSIADQQGNVQFVQCVA